jgi:thiamine-monophosphate kinase
MATGTADEFALIARYFAPLAQAFPGAFGLLDDAAVISPSAGHELVLKTDTIVGDVDFPPTQPPEFVARKVLRVNLSDLAAKGARPRAYLLDLVLPRSTEESWIARFASGLADDQREFGIHLAGGDTSSSAGPVTVAVTAVGEVPVGRMIRRSTARQGDSIFVTGTIGDAALGLAVLKSQLSLAGKPSGFLLDRYNLPQPRTMLGPKLAGIATASIDISDGLVADLKHICQASGLSAMIESRSVPLSDAAREAVGLDSRWLTQTLAGGDDYEILFTAPADVTPTLRNLSDACGIPITRIGRMTRISEAVPDVTVLDNQGQAMQFSSSGWTHFGE